MLEQPEDPALSPLLDELAAPGDSTEAQLIQRTERVLYTWFRRARRAADDRQWAAWVGRKRDKSGGVHFVRPNALRALSHDAPGGSGGLQKQTLFSFLQGRTPEPILRRYVEDCFGASMLTPGQLSEAERTCAPACTRTAGCTLPAANRWAARPRRRRPGTRPTSGSSGRRTGRIIRSIWWKTSWPSHS